MQTKHGVNALRLRGFLLVASLAVTLFALNGNVAAQAQTCPGAPQSHLVVGRTAVITDGNTPNLRDQPGMNGKILSKMDAGTQLSVLAGPTCADNYAWWQVSLPYDSTTTGWMAEGSGSAYFLDPTTTPITKATIPDGATSVAIKFGNASLTYTGIWGKSVEADGVFGFKGSVTQDMPPFALNPDYTEFRFVMVPPPNDNRMAEVDVFPVDAYVKLVASVKDEETKLRKLLTDKPTNFPYNSNGQNLGIPALPLANAGQVITAKARYLPFEGGTGVRFITFYAQDVSPITNDRIEYYYQGLTQDGKYWISARFPLKSSLLANKLEDDKDFPDLSKVTDATPIQKYYGTVKK